MRGSSGNLSRSGPSNDPYSSGPTNELTIRELSYLFPSAVPPIMHDQWPQFARSASGTVLSKEMLPVAEIARDPSHYPEMAQRSIKQVWIAMSASPGTFWTITEAFSDCAYPAHPGQADVFVQVHRWTGGGFETVTAHTTCPAVTLEKVRVICDEAANLARADWESYLLFDVGHLPGYGGEHGTSWENKGMGEWQARWSRARNIVSMLNRDASGSFEIKDESNVVCNPLCDFGEFGPLLRAVLSWPVDQRGDSITMSELGTTGYLDLVKPFKDA